MPKVIENLRTTILEEAKAELADKGYGDLTVRQIASKCNIAVGTVYNYFKSKDVILGVILGEDWHNVLSSMDESIGRSHSVHEGLCIVADGLEGFCSRYSRLWSEYRRTESSDYYSRNGHQMLLNALMPRVGVILDRNQVEREEGLCRILCEAMIGLATHGESYKDSAHIIERMIEKDKH